MDWLKAFNFAPKWYFDPIFVDSNNLDLTRPALFVGNHTLYGLLDVPLMLEHIKETHGIRLITLGDKGHFSIPGWRSWLTYNGMVLGTPENCDRLMEAGESILVFPGGGREVMRRKGEQYKLIWKKRLGFARMAMKHGYDILPFASLGPDDCYDILLDADDIQQSKMWNQLTRIKQIESAARGGDLIPPLSKGLGLTMLPKPQRFYFSFGSRISTAEYDMNNEASLWKIRNEVADSIYDQLGTLKGYRNSDRANWHWIRKACAPIPSVD